MLHDDERGEISAHCEALTRALDRVPKNETDLDAEGETNVTVTKMMLALPAPQATPGSTIAIADAYAAALDDVPCWAVALAMRGWYRGEHRHEREFKGERHDFNWRPSPAALRSLSMRMAYDTVGQRLAQLRRLLAATERFERSNGDRVEMLKKLAALNLGAK